MAKVKLVGSGERVVFGKMMYPGEVRELHPRQVEQLLAMDPVMFVINGLESGQTEGNGQTAHPGRVLPAGTAEQGVLEMDGTAMASVVAPPLTPPHPKTDGEGKVVEEVSDEHKPKRAGKPSAGRRAGAKQRS